MNDKERQITQTATIRTVAIFIICIASLFLIAQFDAIKKVVGTIAEMLSPVIVGVILAYVLNPLSVFIERRFSHSFVRIKKMSDTTRKRLSRALGIILSLVILVTMVALLFLLIIPEFMENLDVLIDITPELFKDAEGWMSGLTQSDNVILQKIGEYADSGINGIVGFLGDKLGDAVAGIIESIVSVFSFFLDLLISVVICIYALIEKDRFVSQSKKLIYALLPKRLANDFLAAARYGNEVFGKYITGKLLTSTIVGVVTFLFMTLVGMPYALLSAVIIAITNVIPFFGPFIGGIPTAFIVIVSDFRQGIIYVIFLLVLQQVEGNIIEPMIMEDRTGVSKFWITFALILCGGLFGIAGMIFSAPIFAVLFYCIKVIVERSLKSKGLPLSSTEYLNLGSIDVETGEIKPIPAPPPHKKFTQAVQEWWDRIQNGTVVIADLEEQENAHQGENQDKDSK